MAVAVVTGATGFIGIHLVAYLRSLNWQVIALARKTSNVAVLTSLGAEVVRMDITDRTAMLAAVPNQADVIFHLACAPFGSGFQADYIARVNEDGLRNALFAATDKKATCLVYVSDAVCYGASDGIIIDKTQLAEPQSLQGAYARSRRECEAIFGRAIARGLDAVCVMPSAVLGHGLRQYRMRPFEAVLNSETVYPPEGGRNFVDVASFVPVLVRAAERGMTGQRYLVGGAYQSWADILQRFIDVNDLSTRLAKPRGLGRVAKMIKNLGKMSAATDRSEEWMWSLKTQLSAEISQSDLGFQTGDLDGALKTIFSYLRS